MKMTQVQELRRKIDADGFFTAEDTLAGWKVIPGFIYGYTRCSTDWSGNVADEVVALFEVEGQPVNKGEQRVAYVPVTE